MPWDGSTELSAVHDDGKAWKHHGVNGNQSQMLMMMSQESPAASDVSMGMMNHLQEAAYRSVANAEEESASQWSLPDSMENPNRQGL